MKKYELKTDPAVFEAVAAGAKTHEIRFNDRDFAVGDILLLRETTATGAEIAHNNAQLQYTGRQVLRQISHIQTGYGLADGWVILSFNIAPQLSGNSGELPTVFVPVLTEKEIDFVQRVLRAPGYKLNGDGESTDYSEGAEINALWKRPENLKIVEVLGSYKWRANDLLIQAVNQATRIAIASFAVQQFNGGVERQRPFITVEVPEKWPPLRDLPGEVPT